MQGPGFTSQHLCFRRTWVLSCVYKQVLAGAEEVPGSVWGELLPTCFFLLFWVIYMSRRASIRGGFISEHPQASLVQRLPEF